jgi:hypothetical protein
MTLGMVATGADADHLSRGQGRGMFGSLIFSFTSFKRQFLLKSPSLETTPHVGEGIRSWDST